MSGAFSTRLVQGLAWTVLLVLIIPSLVAIPASSSAASTRS